MPRTIAAIKVHVWVDETRPRNQGAKLTAWELGQHGVPHAVIADNVGGHLMQHGLVDLVITGSDRTTYTGDVTNKIGTYLKALAARDNHVPFYVALPSSTFDWKMRDGLKEIPIEQRDATEVTHIEGLYRGEVVSVLLTPEGQPRRQLRLRCDPRPAGDRADHGARHLSGVRRQHSGVISRTSRITIMSETKRILVTGATGKVGQTFIKRLLDDPGSTDFTVRALCHNRVLDSRDRLEIIRGSLQERDTVERAMQGVTHVLHLATTKETPDTWIDVSIKGLFWLLENCRTNPTFKQFILIGGDNSVGHFVYPKRDPGHRGTEAYALSRRVMRCPRCWKKSCWSSTTSSTI